MNRRLRAVPSDQDKGHSLKDRKDSLVGKLAPLTVEDVPPPFGMPADKVPQFRQAVQWIIDSQSATVGDRMAVIELGRVWADLHTVSMTLEQDGLVMESEDKLGNVKLAPHPLMAERARLRGLFKVLLGEFGMTPNSRRMLVTNDPEKKVDAEDEAWAAFAAQTGN